MDELIISIPILILTSLIIFKLNPRYCARCEHGTYFPMYQNLHGKKDYPVFQYCLKCFFYINMSQWKCDSCLASGNHRINRTGFLHRFLVIKNRKNVYKTCQCGNIVELVQK